MPLDEIVRRAASLSPAPHRGAVARLARGITVFDDSYNSSPSALEHALEALAHERRAARKAAVLGEMLELGEHAVELHERCGTRRGCRTARSLDYGRRRTGGGDGCGSGRCGNARVSRVVDADEH